MTLQEEGNARLQKWVRRLERWAPKSMFCTVGRPGDALPLFTQIKLDWTRIPKLERLRLHIFWRSDPDAPHCHMWGFWTFPLNKRGYIEEQLWQVEQPSFFWKGKRYTKGQWIMRERYVAGRKWTYRSASYTHRVLYPDRASGGFFECSPRSITEQARESQCFWPIVTICYRERKSRDWGFWLGDPPQFMTQPEYDALMRPALEIADAAG